MALAIDQTPTITETVLSGSIATGAFTTTTGIETIVVMCTSDGFVQSAQTFSIADNNSNPYYFIVRSNNQSGDGTCEAWFALVTSVQTNLVITATCSSGTTDRLNLQVVTLSGADQSNPIGATGAFPINGAAVSGSITTKVTGSYVFSAFSNASGAVDNTTTVVGAGQTKISQGTPGVVHGEGTFWRQTSRTVSSPLGITSTLTTPATDTGDLIVFEITPPGGINPFVGNGPTNSASYVGGPAPQPISVNIAI